MKNVKAGSYPIVVKITYNYLHVSCPDFDIHYSKIFSEIRKAEEIGRAWMTVQEKVAEEIKRRNSTGKTLPVPTHIKNLDEKKSSLPDMKISEVAAMLGVHVSTIRRMEEKSEIQSYPTPGGHRRYRYTDVIQKKKSLTSPTPSTALKSLESQSPITPLEIEFLDSFLNK